MGENISSWINKSFIRGKVNEGFIFMRGTLSKNPFYNDYSGISFARLNLNNLNFQNNLLIIFLIFVTKGLLQILYNFLQAKIKNM